jgi:thymidine phosphorylase
MIARKRDGHALSADEIGAFIRGYTDGSVPDYQMSAMAMAIHLRGMTGAETAALTECMFRSGAVLEWASAVPAKVDKHSTGGIGDKTSLILVPLLACCGLRVPMLSGRGLGATGGTLDKLESIPGFRTNLSRDEIRGVVERVSCAITGTTSDLVPADLMEVTLALGAELLVLTWLTAEPSTAIERLKKLIASGEALEKFRQMVAAQGGDLDAPRPVAKAHEVLSPHAGFISAIDAEALGLATIELGGGRKKLTDSLDLSTGLEILVRLGDPVERGQPLVSAFAGRKADDAAPLLHRAFSIGERQPASSPLILERIGYEPD